MRLTNVAHMRLPFGRLFGFDLEVRPGDRELPISIDQGRHVAEGERPGSWMAISFRLPGRRDLDDLSAAWRMVVDRHGTLRTVFLPGPRLVESEVRGGSWREHRIAPGQEVNRALQGVFDTTCTPHSAPSHRLCVLQTAEASWVVIGADHSHVDMWSLLVVMRDFLDCLAGTFDPGTRVPTFAEHTTALVERDPAPADVRDRWREVLTASGDVMPRFPLPLGADGLYPERVEVRDVLDVAGVRRLGELAAAAGASTLSYVVAAMTAVTRELTGDGLRAVFPVHSRYDTTWQDSVGWFITNSVLDSPSDDPAEAATAIKEAIKLGSWPLADVLEPLGGFPQAPGMFAISWLDLRRLPVKVDSQALEASYVGASVLTDGVMVWFILDWTGLHLRCRYPDTDLARVNVGGWLDRVVDELRLRVS